MVANLYGGLNMTKLIAPFNNYLKLVYSYSVVNLKSQMEYRGAFFSQVLAMIFNNCVWVLFWTVFYSKYAVLRGWTIKDVVTLWAIACAGFGIAHALCGNALHLPVLIMRGQLDAWMLYPRRLLPHLLLGKMSASAIGDAIFGFATYFVVVCPDLTHATLFIALSIAVAFAYIGFSIFTGSLAFFIGNAEVLAEQLRGSLITFSTFPPSLFEGWFKIVLFTVLPAAYVSYLPVDALHNMSLVSALETLAGSAAVFLVGVFMFAFGLTRYESGNLMEMRG
jgi:ABC-2 type transport system permease protein